MHLKLNSMRKNPVLCDIFVIFSLELFAEWKKNCGKKTRKKVYAEVIHQRYSFGLVLLRAWEWASWLLVEPNFREKKRNKKDLLCFNLAARYTDFRRCVCAGQKDKTDPSHLYTYTHTHIHLNAHAALAMHLVLIAAALVFAMPITGFGW